MPGDLAIQPIQPAGAEPQSATWPATGPADAPAVPASTAVGGSRANPSMRIDAALGLVVLEFRDAGGRVTASLPDARQLDAYRAAQWAGTQPAHAGLHKPATRVP